MMADRIIRWSTAGASYEHAYDLVRAHGEVGWTACLVPLTVDGLIYASSMVMLDSARRKAPAPGLARWLLGLGIAATLAANHVPSVRTIRARLHVGQPRAQRVQAYLATITSS
jgi:hypothetical protein